MASYCFLKSGENENICILKSFPWARGCCIHVFLVYMYRIGYVVWLLRNMITSNEEKNIRMKIMYDIACLHVKHLQVSYQQLTHVCMQKTFPPLVRGCLCDFVDFSDFRGVAHASISNQTCYQ